MSDKREQIIGRHIDELLDELRLNGFRPIGIAGGIIMNLPSDDGGYSRCHVFCFLDGHVHLAESPDLDKKNLLAVFLQDVAQTMLKKVGEQPIPVLKDQKERT